MRIWLSKSTEVPLREQLAKQALGIGGIGMATGMMGGIVLTKGNQIRAASGTTLRIKFLKPATLPVLQPPTTRDPAE